MNTTKFLVLIKLIFEWGIYRQLTNKHAYYKMPSNDKCSKEIKQVREQGVTKGCFGSGVRGGLTEVVIFEKIPE